MLQWHHKDAGLPAACPLQVSMVRMLETSEEIQAAVARAQEFDRKSIELYERRTHVYDRLLSDVGTAVISAERAISSADDS